MNKGEGKSTVSRRIKILETLKSDGQVNVKDLSEALGVTGVTIRNDLAQLEKKNILIRARGGAIKIDQNYLDEDFPLSDKQKKHLFEKREIGKKHQCRKVLFIMMKFKMKQSRVTLQKLMVNNIII